jgi:hypothetical protein
MKQVFQRPSPAMVIAMVALLATLGGTAIAATVLSKRQVRKIAKTVVKQSAGQITKVEGPTVVIPPGQVGSASVTCPSGQGFVSGGYSYISAEGEIFYADSFTRNTWSVGGDNFDSPVSGDLTAIAFCAPAGKAVKIARASVVDQRVDEAVARQKAKHGL